jgi:hypothetical protein
LALELTCFDKLYGGVGSRRGRTNRHDIHSGDAFGFWVLYANKEEGIILFAEMKLQGEAWQFKIINQTLYQSILLDPEEFGVNSIGTLFYLSMVLSNGMLNKLIKE